MTKLAVRTYIRVSKHKGSMSMVDFDEELMKAETLDEVKKMKVWLFRERVRIQARYDELDDLSQELQKERLTLERERNALNLKIEAEKKRFQDREAFVAKKLKIIENAYQQLALDKKALECERLNFEYERGNYNRKKRQTEKNTFNSNDLNGIVFFRGVDNQLALRKRYRDLMKIFHPDNKCGDTKTLQKIQAEYDEIRKKYYEV